MHLHRLLTFVCSRRHCRSLGLTVLISGQNGLLARFPAGVRAWLLPAATSLSRFTSFQGNWLRPLSMQPQFYPPALSGLVKQLTATWQTLSKQTLLGLIVFF